MRWESCWRSANRILLCLALITAARVVLAAEKNSPVFRAGAATSNITPSLDLNSPIAGAWSSPPGNYIHDELRVRCLVLDDGETQIAMATADNIGIPEYVLDEAKRRTEARTGIAADRILVAATHTHSGASARGRDSYSLQGELDGYQDFVADRIADSVRRAVHNLEPARVGWGKCDLPDEVFNRRWLMKPGTPLPNPFEGVDRVRMNPGVGNPDILDPSGPIDPEICFLSLQSADGRPIALFANYSLHYVGGVPRGHISADYFAVFCEKIADLLAAPDQDPPFVAVMSNGASGNINNINYRGGQPKMPPYGQMRLVAHRAAAKVFRAYQDLEYQDWIPVRMSSEKIPVATRRPAPELLVRAKRILKNPEDYPNRGRPSPQAWVSYAKSTVRLSKYPPQIEIPLQAIRIGDVAITAIPFEVFVEIGLEIKEKSPFGQSFTISHANGSFGYLPTPEQHELGGYETWLGTSRVEVNASTKIIQRLLDMLGNLR